MRKSVRREIRNLLGDAEDALGPKTYTERTDNPQNYRARDLLATACDAVWYGKHTRKVLVSSVRRLLEVHPKPELVLPIAALLVDNLARAPEPVTEPECPNIEICNGFHAEDCELSEAEDLETELEPEQAAA